MNEIKPCLSCKHPVEKQPMLNSGGESTYWVFCPECGMHGPCFYDEEGAIRLWNLLPRIPDSANELNAPAIAIHTGIFARIWAQGFNACRDKMIEAAQEKHDETHSA